MPLVKIDYRRLFERLTRRYGGAKPQALEAILCPVLIPIRSLGKTIIKMAGQSHYRGSFTVTIDRDCEDLIVPGRTGEFVPASYRDGGVWKELAKGRVLTVDRTAGIAEGEVYTGASGKKAELETALGILSAKDCWEVDQYGANAERNDFHSVIKYHRDDRFLTEHILDDATRARLDQAWTDLLTAFEYHNAFFRFVVRKFKLELEEGRSVGNLSQEWIDKAPDEPRRFVEILSEQYASAHRALKAAEPGHIEDALRFAQLAWRRPLSDAEKSRLPVDCVDG